MPWEETCVVDERMRFIAAVLEDPRGNLTQLCRRFGISRANGYKWIARYKEFGPDGLRNKPPVAREHPNRLPDEVVDRVVQLRKDRPHDGPKKLRALLLEREPLMVVPSASTIGEILDRHGLVRPRHVRLRVPPSTNPLSHAELPNDVWCTDFKGDFLLGDGKRCHPLTLTDAVARYLLKCEGLEHQTDVLVRPHFERAFREFGLPLRMRSDNGPPFASKAIGGLSRLSVWWIQLGITPERIEPGKPQQNGRHERMHLTLKQQTASPPEETMADQQRAMDRFRHDYNDVRPHEALGQTPPARHYEPSLRLMPDKPRDPEYGADVEVRRARPDGYVNWRGAMLKLTPLLSGQPVAFKAIDQDEWELWYGPVLLGHALLRDGKPKLDPLR
jgi:putative transposase